jgi:hypothetical protein
VRRCILLIRLPLPVHAYCCWVLMFAVVIVMQWSVAGCPMVVYLLKHLIHFVIDKKAADTCFYTWMVSGIFDLARFAFFILRKYHFVSLLHYFLILEN